MHDALGQGEGVVAAKAEREPLMTDAENRLAFIETRSSYSATKLKRTKFPTDSVKAL